jgi:hypothetical protein
LKNSGDCDLSKYVQIGEQRDQLFCDAFFPTDFGVKKTRKIQEKTIKEKKNRFCKGSPLKKNVFKTQENVL